MKIKLNNIILPPGQQPDSEVVSDKLGIPPEKIRAVSVMKFSVDARRKNNIRFVYSLLTEVDDETKVQTKPDVFVLKDAPAEEFNPQRKYRTPPVIAGMGPAGLFCGYILAKYGYNPIIIEQGKDVDERTKDVRLFKNGGCLVPDSNIQFGEGGAGTFSDGKLTTRINDPLCSLVLETMHKFGAPGEILYMAKPHVGTDILKNVVKNIRMEIQRLGGKVLFGTKLTGISHNGKISCIKINGQDLDCEALVLAIGHSSRDTFAMLQSIGVFMEPKAFAVGVRAEHEQEFINRAQYGEAAGKYGLRAAEYFLKYNGDGRSCYSFCMCPGGEVVPAASEEGGVVTNGMSNYSRDGKYANSGIVVSVSPEDFGTSPLSGVRFQRELEQKAFRLGGENYSAPAQYCRDFVENRKSVGDILTTYSRKAVACNLRDLFPGFICKTMTEGFAFFDKKIPGFVGKRVPIIGVESRTSSPVRITRGDDLQSISVKGIYPCGEGAGYAGGIMSAAVDGIKVAKQIMSNN